MKDHLRIPRLEIVAERWDGRIEKTILKNARQAERILYGMWKRPEIKRATLWEIIPEGAHLMATWSNSTPDGIPPN